VKWDSNQTLALHFNLDQDGTRVGTFALPPLILAKVDIQVHQAASDMTLKMNAKACLYATAGAWRSSRGVCEVFRQLKRVCIVVAKHQGEWNLVGGCATGAQMAEYKQVPARGRLGDGQRPEEPIDMSGVDVEVRSNVDPLLTALAVTSGSLDFGRSPSQLRDNALKLLLLAAITAAPFIWQCCLVPKANILSPAGDRFHDLRLVFDDADDL